MVADKASATPDAKRRSRSKSVKKKLNKLTPFEERLKEPDAYTSPHLDDFSKCGNIKVILPVDPITGTVLITDGLIKCN